MQGRLRVGGEYIIMTEALNITKWKTETSMQRIRCGKIKQVKLKLLEMKYIFALI